MKLPALIVCLLLLSAPLAAQTDAEQILTLREFEQRAWIASARRQYQEEFMTQEIACYQRFAVNDCLSDSRRRQREILADLRRKEILINDAQRKRRAAQQLLRTDERLEHGP